MNIPKEVMDKAVEGGWPRGKLLDPAYVVLDATFWQALGKALGWAKEVKGDFAEEAFFATCEQKAMRFYRLVFNGTDTEKFWADLLK